MDTMEKENNLNQIFTIFISSLSTFTCGLLFAWPSPSIPILTSEDYPVKITIEECSYFPIIPPITMLLSSPIYSILMNRIGRKYTVLFIAVPQLLAAILTSVSNSIYIFYLSRLLNGIGDGGVFTVLPAYIGEIATPKVRGSWGNMTTLGIYLGEFVINLIGTYLNVEQTGYVMSVMPESPYYLLMKDKREEASKTLKKLRMKENVEAELKQLELDVNRQISESGTFKDLFTISSNRKAGFVAGFVRISQQFSGISSFVVYNQYMFQEAGGDISYTTSSIIFMGILFFCNIIASFNLDKMGRRLTMLISCGGCFVILLSQAIYFYFKDYTSINVSSVNWYPIVGMILYTLIYSVGLGIVPTLMLSEIFSTSVKGVGLTFMNVVFAFASAGSTKLFQVLNSYFGLLGPMLLFMVCCFFSTIVSYFFVPETKGKTLEEIQQELKGLFTFCCFFSTIVSYFFVPETKGKTLEEIQQELKGKKETVPKQQNLII